MEAGQDLVRSAGAQTPRPVDGTREDRAPEECRRRRIGSFLTLLSLAALAAAALVLAELYGSFLQSRIFSAWAEGFAYGLAHGPSERIRFPERGPHDERLGYTRIPDLVARLDERDFELVAQARLTPALLQAVDLGVYPIYPVKDAAGLTVLDREGRSIVFERYPARAFATFDRIPEVLWRSLLFVESREFLDPRFPRRNPAVEWDRLARGVAALALRALGREGSVPGGSTLATQIEKFRHSPDGVTRTPRDKLRQMVSASLRAYQEGPETYEERLGIVTEYLNSVPLAAQVGHGEVIGTADGLWAWYGSDLTEARRILASEPDDRSGRVRMGQTYRQALSLLLAHRRPSYYLATEPGRESLAGLTDTYLDLLAAGQVIPWWLAVEARRARATVRVLDRAPPREPLPFAERKASIRARTHLLSLTGVAGLYDLDRLDLTAISHLDREWNRRATDVLRSMADPAFLRENGFAAPQLLAVGDPSEVLYSVLLMESTEGGNVIRLQADNFEGPLSLAESSRLELGSTAKLRTLVTYLEIVDELHFRFAELPPDSLARAGVLREDHLTRWAADLLARRPGMGVDEMLDSAMRRTYSASPRERFVTGGGVQTFSNFDSQHDAATLTVREAFRNSVNLPFVRIMRDIVAYEMHRTGSMGALRDAADPARRDYLVRFAEIEGAKFIRQFFAKYRDRTGPAVLDALVGERRLGHRRLAWAFRAVAPDAGEEAFRDFVRRHAPGDDLSDAAFADLYRRSDPTPHTLSDLGYLAGIHPLDLWMASAVLHEPGIGLAAVLERSRDVRVEVYGWLFRTRYRNAQDARIRTVLEMEAFQGVLERWRRVGYPFENIVPSIGTAIGSSGDRPLALAELTGILLNEGVRRPVVRVEEIRLGEGTPYDSRLRRRDVGGERVLGRAVARAAREAMLDVVANGTGRRARNALVAGDGTPLVVGGKTGTGDNRYRVFAPGGRLTESRVVNRTATFVFFAGERYFGVVVAYVPGQAAGSYRFTSALPAQLFRVLGAELEGLAPPR